MLNRQKKIGINLTEDNIKALETYKNKTGDCFSQIVNKAVSYYMTQGGEYDRSKQR